MTPRKRKLWENCNILFKKHNIVFNTEEEKEDAIKIIINDFLDEVDDVENIILQRYKLIQKNEEFDIDSVKNIEEIKEVVVNEILSEVKNIVKEEYSTFKKKNKKGIK